MLLLSCKKVSKAASAALDRKLTGYERSSFEAHLLICPPCRRNRKQLEVLEKMVRGSGFQESQGEMSAQGKAKIEKALEEREREAKDQS